jgi:hypothetical protein
VRSMRSTFKKMFRLSIGKSPRAALQRAIASVSSHVSRTRLRNRIARSKSSDVVALLSSFSQVAIAGASGACDSMVASLPATFHQSHAAESAVNTAMTLGVQRAEAARQNRQRRVGEYLRRCLRRAPLVPEGNQDDTIRRRERCATP